MKMMVIADDFTGSNDTGVQLAKKGARTEVMLSASQKPSRRADVLVINTESRAMPADQAASAVYAALSPWCETSPAPLVYKKIDSTFRGNIGAEVTAAMRASQRKLAVIAAAIPAAGRTTLEGKCLVNGVPLLETEFASDPKTPIVSSRIAEIVALQSEIPVYEVFLQDVRRGGLSALLTSYAAEGEGIIVVDAVEERDLTLIAQAACEQPSMPLLVGAAGLANALPVELFMQDRQRLPVLVVAGSMSEATRRQVDNALCRGRAEVVDIDAARMVSDSAEQEIASVVEQACALLSQHRHTILRTSRRAEDRQLIDALCEKSAMSRQQLGERLSQRLGVVTLNIIEQARIGGLFLTGGDIATAPLNKEALHLAGHNYPGHTELLATLTHSRDYAMVLYTDKLKVIHVSTHIALRKFLDTLSTARVETVIGIADTFLKRVGYVKPRIAVAGVNPHAGENGLFGDEETRILTPAITDARAKGMDVYGPCPPDTVFLQAYEGQYDMVVAMYHDQGHIPLKLLGFYDGVNITAGLPFIRTSANHGTAFDIAWTGKAKSESMAVSIKLAMQLA
ncbi:4-hydroxythreonine-4-phosphate dehydrogenase PdxA [Salmonella enterica]|nr:4-hydroxythreonine-4-phosphate dehydrogenase PdxA [Salmonella enterica]EHM7257840.1 4-hydroxythreonine-4-phosphate dehydrogenase PdxA [Salmonella enterica]